MAARRAWPSATRRSVPFSRSSARTRSNVSWSSDISLCSAGAGAGVGAGGAASAAGAGAASAAGAGAASAAGAGAASAAGAGAASAAGAGAASAAGAGAAAADTAAGAGAGAAAGAGAGAVTATAAPIGTGAGTTTGAPVMFTGRRGASLPGWMRGAFTLLRSPSSRWKSGAKRMYPKTINRVITAPSATSKRAMSYTHPPVFSVGVTLGLTIT